MIKQVIKLKPNLTDLKIKDLINQLLKIGHIMDINYHNDRHELSFYYEKNKVDTTKLKQIIDVYEVNIKQNSEKLNQFTYRINHLHCANCAKKIEKNLAKIPNIETVNLDFFNKKLTVTTKNNQSKELLKKINYISNKIEPGTKFTELNEQLDQNDNYLTLLLGVIIFIVSQLNFFDIKINFALILIGFTIISYDVMEKALMNLFRAQLFDENFLMTIASIGAIIIGEYHEAFAVMFLYKVGEILQKKAVDKSRKAISQLIEIQPKYANVLIDGELKQVDPKYVRVGDTILIKPGEKIPLDGIIMEGSTSIDQSSITGESIPVYHELGEKVISGGLNLNGTIQVKVTKVYEDSTVNKILQLVNEAQNKKAKVDRFITKFARIYTPIVVFSAILILFLPMFFDSDYSFQSYLYKACVFLVLSCPCALVLSVPLSIFASLGASSKLGILIKGGNHFDTIRKASIIVLDKTGTLTTGNLIVSKAKAVVGYKYQDFLFYAIHAAYYSNHLVSRAIVNYENIEINPKNIESHDELFGLGVKSKINKHHVLVGNKKLMDKYEINFKDIEEKGNVVYVSVDRKLVGYFILMDQIKKEAKETIQILRKQGIEKIVMLTGDKEQLAKEISDELKIDGYYANLLPEEKLELLKQIKRNNKDRKLIYVGDGVNDAPVLAEADLSVAMGAFGSDVAIEVADVVLMNDRISHLVDMINLSILTHRKIIQNIVFSLGVKLVILILSLFGYAFIWAAVFADVGVTLLAVINSISLLRYKSWKE